MVDVQNTEATDREPRGGIQASAVVGLSPGAQRYLDQTRPWVRFMSVVCYISAAFMALVGIGMMFASLAGGLGAGAGSDAVGGAIAGLALGVTYIPMALLYVIAGRYLGRYAGAIRLLRTNLDARTLEAALGHQKSFWKFTGIVTIVAFACCVLLFAVVAIVGVAAAMAARG